MEDRIKETISILSSKPKRKQVFGIARNILQERELCHAIVENHGLLFNGMGKPLNSKR